MFNTTMLSTGGVSEKVMQIPELVVPYIRISDCRRFEITSEDRCTRGTAELEFIGTLGREVPFPGDPLPSLCLSRNHKYNSRFVLSSLFRLC